MDLDIFCQMILLSIPTSVALSTWMGVGGWVLPISVKVVRMGTAAWPLMKRSVCSDSAAEAMIFRRILYKTWKTIEEGSVRSEGNGIGSGVAE